MDLKILSGVKFKGVCNNRLYNKVSIVKKISNSITVNSLLLEAVDPDQLTVFK